MPTPLKRLLRAVRLGLFGLFGLFGLAGLALLLSAAWLALNHRDLPAQPWPAALELPANRLPATDNLLFTLKAKPQRPGELRLGDCQVADCLSVWRAQLPALAAQRAANARFGDACLAQTQVVALRFEEPLPRPLRIESPMPQLGPLRSCHGMLLGLALQAAEDGDAPVALQWLQQADRLDRAVLAGARSVAAQAVGLRMASDKLQALVAVALRQPTLRPALPPLAAVDPRALLERQRDWVRVEANFNRAAIDSLREPNCAPPQLAQSWLEKGLCRITAGAAQPEYTLQWMASRWLRLDQQLQAAQSLAAALPALQATQQHGPEPSAWQRLRHTVPHVLDDVARPAYAGYFERTVDFQLAAEATGLWLQGQLPSQASPELRQRLQPPGGEASSWRLAPQSTDSLGRLPLQWPAST